MNSLTYPDKPSPQYQQQTAGGRSGPSLCIGVVVFLIVVFGGILIGSYFLIPLFDNFDFADIGLSPIAIASIIMISVIVVSFAIIARGDMLHSGMGVRYRDRDPSICSRVIKDGYDGQEFIVSGSKDTTFAEACKANWQFESVSLKSKWFIKDEKGNDVSNRTLESSDGTFIIVPEYESEIVKDEKDESEEYSSIHDSVTYYD